MILCSLTTTLGYLALARSLNYAVRSLGVAAVLGEVSCLLAAVLCSRRRCSGSGSAGRRRRRFLRERPPPADAPPHLRPSTRRLERVLEPVVPPVHLSVDEEGGRTEDAQRLRPLHLRPEQRPLRPGARPRSALQGGPGTRARPRTVSAVEMSSVLGKFARAIARQKGRTHGSSRPSSATRIGSTVFCGKWAGFLHGSPYFAA